MSDPAAPLRRLQAALTEAAAAQGIEAIGFDYSLGEDNPLHDRIIVTFRSDPDRLSVPPEAAATADELAGMEAATAAAERTRAAEEARRALAASIDRRRRTDGGVLDDP